PRRRCDEAEDRERGHALATPRLADHGQRLAGSERERHAVHGAQHAVVCEEVGLELTQLEQRFAHVPPPGVRRGSRASRRPSPRKLNAITVRKIATPGDSSIHGNDVSTRWLRAAFSMLPQLAAGGWTPTPRKLRNTSPRM